MALERERLEVDRIVNLVTGFGWKMTKQEFQDEKIVIQLERVREVPAAPPPAGAD